MYEFVRNGEFVLVLTVRDEMSGDENLTWNGPNEKQLRSRQMAAQNLVVQQSQTEDLVV
jgi:hypothetical protein